MNDHEKSNPNDAKGEYEKDQNAKIKFHFEKGGEDHAYKSSENEPEYGLPKNIYFRNGEFSFIHLVFYFFQG